MRRVTIIDYGHGNANSIKLALASLGVTSTYSRQIADIDSADFLILPGVGHHGAAMRSLRESELQSALTRAARERKIPTLGICLGMQMMTESSEEGGLPGLGWVPAATERIKPANRKVFKVPHVGWNVIRKDPSSTLLEGIDTESEPFYFCHSFAIQAAAGAGSTSLFRYDRDYVAVFERENIMGVQFHPEKSQEPGARLLANFLRLSR
ncbi:MAG: imidazole glycerol phosphate synthase subunit HisH [Labilithrix sp.]|nr:imidazole glycerol phosphate synthase subunit HisH [Labilithrix sp.]